MNHCSIGPCAAEDGHAGTCDQASGWDDEAGERNRHAAWVALRRAQHLARLRDPQYVFDISEAS